jgi:hypothetical protein
MELVQVAVPADRLLEVYALLGNAKASAVANQEDASNGTKPWTEEALSQRLKEASETIRGEAKYLASHPDEEVTSEDIVKALKLPGWHQLAGSNGGWGHLLKNLGYAFPWETRVASDGRSRMKMSAEIAALVNKVL